MSRDRPALRVLLCLSFMAIALLATARSASAHAAFESSDPEAGTRLDEPPAQITVSYAEPPTQESRFTVFDGCGSSVAEFGVLNRTIEASVTDAQPGKWRVEWGVISAVDGHLTRDEFTFTVAGEPDCSQAAAPDETDDSASGPGSGVLIPVAIATVVIVAIAALVRRAAR